MLDRSATGRRRARPLADAPVAPLLAASDELAKAWLLELIAAAPLAAAAAIPAAELARDAPALCAAIVRALAGDEEAQRLAPGGDLAALAASVGRLSGAGDHAAAAAAVEALRSVLWRAAVAELRDPEPALVAELAERLAHVCATVTAAVLGAQPSAPAREPEPGPFAAPLGAVTARRGAAAQPWLAAIEGALERRADAEPLAVLLVEVDGVERLLAAAQAGEAGAALERAERVLGAELRAPDTLVAEGPGRFWILSATSAEGAAALAARLATAVERSVALAGAPLTASVGIAACPGDGAEAAALVARAEEGVYAARAAGVRTVGLEPPGPPAAGGFGPRLVP